MNFRSDNGNSHIFMKSNPITVMKTPSFSNKVKPSYQCPPAEPQQDVVATKFLPPTIGHHKAPAAFSTQLV